MKKFKKRLLFIATIVTSVIYIVWRTFFTLPFKYGVIPMIFGVILLLAELIGFLEAANIYIGMVKSYEPEKPSISAEEFPEIDVFIATYNEPEELLKKTINGCLNMDYPDKSKVHIYVCDDGNRESIRLLAEHMKVSYIKRDEHKHAKAGNYNNALSCTYSPLIATFDADMIPMHDFLMELVPYFFLPEYEKGKDGVWKKREEKNKNLKIGFIQSPQSFYNADLFQYNLYSEATVPNEQNFFFKQVQLSRNSANSAIYSGSNTILSRQALEEVGGFYTESITEDLATGLLIQGNGYKGYAIGSVHANGLSPTDIVSLFKQRERWARGCIQTSKKLHLFTRKGLSIGQKMNYFFSTLYWYTSLRRCIFILAPILFSVFNIPVLDCTLVGILIFWLPQILMYNAALSGLTGKTRTSRLSNIYDTILFPSLLPGVILETVGITRQQFFVTNKDKKAKHNDENKKFAYKSAIVHIVLLILSIIGITRCLYETILYQTPGYLVILFWLFANGYNIVMALFFLLGRNVYRNTDRFSIREKLVLSFDEQKLETTTINMSEGGAAFLLDFPVYIPYDKKIDISISSMKNRYYCCLKAQVVHVQQSGDKWKYAVKFLEINEENLLQLYGILHDRVAPMQTKVSDQSSFYEDMMINVHRRLKKEFSSNRSLTRINLDVKLKADECEFVVLKNFNYEYVFLEMYEDLETVHVLIDKNQELKLVCKQVKHKERSNDNTYLYHVENYKALIYNKYFMSILSDWIDQYVVKKKEEKEYLMSMKKEVYKDEFTDMQYISVTCEAPEQKKIEDKLQQGGGAKK